MRCGADVFEDLNSRFFGQVNVQDNQRGRICFPVYITDSFFPVRHYDDPRRDAAMTDGFTHQKHIRRIILHHQYCRIRHLLIQPPPALSIPQRAYPGNAPLLRLPD